MIRAQYGRRGLTLVLKGRNTLNKEGVRVPPSSCLIIRGDGDLQLNKLKLLGVLRRIIQLDCYLFISRLLLRLFRLLLLLLFLLRLLLALFLLFIAANRQQHKCRHHAGQKTFTEISHNSLSPLLTFRLPRNNLPNLQQVT